MCQVGGTSIATIFQQNFIIKAMTMLFQLMCGMWLSWVLPGHFATTFLNIPEKVSINNNINIYYTIGTQKRAITPIDDSKYPALLHSLRPG